MLEESIELSPVLVRLDDRKLENYPEVCAVGLKVHNDSLVNQGVGASGRLESDRREIQNNLSDQTDRTGPVVDGSSDVIFSHQDIDQNRIRVNRAIAFLLRASNILSRNLDLNANLVELSELIVPSISDEFIVYMVGKDGVLHTKVSTCSSDITHQRVRISVVSASSGSSESPREKAASIDKELRDMLYKWAHESRLASQPIVFAKGQGSIETMQRLNLPSVDEDLSRLGAEGVAIVPILSGGVTIGVTLFVIRVGRRTFDHRDLAMLTELSRRISSAIENARLLQDAEEAREEFRIANKVKGDFLAAMSHELRTPLNAIAGYCQLLLLGLRGNVSDEQKLDIEKIVRNQNHLLVLINSILNYSKIEVGDIHYEISDISVLNMINEIVGTIHSRLLDKGITLICEFPEVSADVEVSVFADKERVRQVVVNLLTNAVKFSSPGGQITIGFKVRGQHVHIFVSDNGVGIPQEKLRTVFDPFVQIDRSLNTIHEGVGLGLSISRDLARAMGGDIMVQSEEGKGSTFTVTFPLSKM